MIKSTFGYVQDLEAGHPLLLRAEMKIPGRAWLEFLLSPQARGRTLVRCCAWFEPRGLLVNFIGALFTLFTS